MLLTLALQRMHHLRRSLARRRSSIAGPSAVRRFADDPIVVLPLLWDGPLVAIPVVEQRRRR